MKEFITPVSMQVTSEQFEADLRKPLESMGYSAAYNVDEKCQYLYTIGAQWSSASIGSPSLDITYKLTNYNPKLFLPLAAMTDSSLGTEFEYWKHNFSGAIFIESDISDFEDFSKATKQDLIKHFSDGLGGGESMLKYADKSVTFKKMIPTWTPEQAKAIEDLGNQTQTAIQNVFNETAIQIKVDTVKEMRDSGEFFSRHEVETLHSEVSSILQHHEASTVIAKVNMMFNHLLGNNAG